MEQPPRIRPTRVAVPNACPKRLRSRARRHRSRRSVDWRRTLWHRPHRDVAKHIACGVSDGTRTRIASLEVQYFTHGMTCGSLISGLNGFHTVIPRCSPLPPVLSGTDLARRSLKVTNNRATCDLQS
jgi:hypothetical protein